MFKIDMLTIMFVLVAMNFIAALFFMLYMHLTKQVAYLGYFILSKSVQGVSWLVRLIVYLNFSPILALAADVLVILGYALESSIFVSYKLADRTKMKLFYLVTLSVSLGGILLTHTFSQDLKNLIILISFLGYMSMTAWSLIMVGQSTRFQRLLGLTYALIPLVLTVLFIMINDEVVTLGYSTTTAGFYYYTLIILMQIVGSTGFLLMVKENDENRLMELATKDPLTGVLNRKAFFDFAEVSLQKAIKDRLPISVLMIDIDFFKSVNDTYGHQVGDHVIQDLCTSVTRIIRKEDLFSRYGGEEFVVFLYNCSESESDLLATRIFNSINEHQKRNYELPHYTVSIGLGTITPKSKNDLDLLMNSSDKALYYGKNNGRNCVARVLDFNNQLDFKMIG